MILNIPEKESSLSRIDSMSHNFSQQKHVFSLLESYICESNNEK